MRLAFAFSPGFDALSPGAMRRLAIGRSTSVSTTRGAISFRGAERATRHIASPSFS
jgi:hypothetical protein